MAQTHTEYYKSLLHSRVKSAKSVADFTSMLQFISLQIIQDLVINQIEQFDPATIRNVFYETVSINTALCEDNIQHILSFNNEKNKKTVSKTWNECSQKNAKIQLRERNEAVNNEKFEHDLKYTELNTTWIIHPTRKELTENEIKSGYKGPLNTINQALSICDPGDKCLFHDGEYTYNEDIVIDKNIQFIGIGDNVYFKDNLIWTEDCCVYFENITIDTQHSDNDEAIRCGGDHSKVWMKGCTFKFGTIAIYMHPNCDLNVLDCEFIGGWTAIVLPDAGNITVIGCLFKNCSEGYACIELPTDDVCCVQLKCIGNIFENNMTLPIGSNGQLRISSDQYLILKNNILKGYNRTGFEITDANKIYILHNE